MLTSRETTVANSQCRDPIRFSGEHATVERQFQDPRDRGQKSITRDLNLSPWSPPRCDKPENRVTAGLRVPVGH